MRDEISDIVWEELTVDEDIGDIGGRVADRILALPVEGWEIEITAPVYDRSEGVVLREFRPATLQEVIDWKARKV